MASASNGTNSVSYTYNNDGYRTSKTVNGTTTDYTLEGSKVLIEKTGSDYVWFYYDAAGAPVAMATGSGPSLYIYRKNLQGDVTGIYSGSTGTLLVSYVYDAWGKVTATNVAGTTESATVLARNPYLYRGNRYDSETGLYYLNSRYYDPKTGRFINADGFVSTGQGILGNNMFAYCENNPANYVDNNGTDGDALVWWSSTMWWVCAIDGPFPLADIIFSTVTLVLTIESIKTIADGEPLAGDLPTINDIDERDEELTIAPPNPPPPSNKKKDDRKTKSENKTPRNNQAQNRQAKNAAKEAGLNKNQKRLLHNEITGRGYSYREILEMAYEIKRMSVK